MGWKDVGWKHAFALTLLILILTSAPYAFGDLSTPEERQFIGIQLNVVDHLQYLTWMRSHQEQGFFISNRMTPEPNQPVFFNSLWWALAQVAAATGLDYAAVYQLFRWIAGLAFGLCIYGFCRLCVEDRFRRMLAFLLIMFTSGFGWALVAQKYLMGPESVPYPLALYLSEANSFLAILGYPHFAIAAAHIVAVFGLFLVSLRRRQLRWAVLAGVVALSLGLQHAYDLLTVYGVIGAFVLLLMVRARRLLWFEVRAVAAVGVISFGPPLYFFYLTRADPLWSQVLEQFRNIGVWTPDPLRLVILMGVILLLGAAAIIADLARPRRDETHGSLFIKTWAVVHLLLIYLPVEFQIHLLNPWQVPLGLLAMAFWLERAVPWARARWPRWGRRAMFSALLLLMVVPTNVYLWSWRFVDLARHDYPYYIYRDDAAALQWIDQNASGDEIVLSSQMIGQFIPGMGGSTAFVAHYAATLDYFGKLAVVERFFDAEAHDAWRGQLIQDYDIRYVYYGENERALGGYEPAQSTLLERAFSSPRVTVYRVLPSQ